MRHIQFVLTLFLFVGCIAGSGNDGETYVIHCEAGLIATHATPDSGGNDQTVDLHAIPGSIYIALLDSSGQTRASHIINFPDQFTIGLTEYEYSKITTLKLAVSKPSSIKVTLSGGPKKMLSIADSIYTPGFYKYSIPKP